MRMTRHTPQGSARSRSRSRASCGRTTGGASTRPELVASAEQHALARIWSRSDGAGPPTAFDVEMEPYLADPFRGAVERRWRAPGETALDIELTAARRALAAADLEPSDVDLALVGSFPADRLGVGNAAFLARELGRRGAGGDLESACVSSVVGLHMAASFVESGRYARGARRRVDFELGAERARRHALVVRGRRRGRDDRRAAGGRARRPRRVREDVDGHERHVPHRGARRSPLHDARIREREPHRARHGRAVPPPRASPRCSARACGSRTSTSSSSTRRRPGTAPSARARSACGKTASTPCIRATRTSAPRSCRPRSSTRRSRGA